MIASEDRLDCALCGSRGEVLYRDVGDRLFSAPGTWQVLRCRCGGVWLNPRPRLEALSQLYESYFTHEASARDGVFKRAVKRGIPAVVHGYDDVAGDAAQRALARVLARIGPLREVAEQSIMALPAAQRGRLLDIGCGAGALLGHMQSLGWEVAGVEPDPAARKIAQRALRTEIWADPSDALAGARGDFDAITLGHVIEHLHDPERTLETCAQLLRPGGWLVIATPNAQSEGHRRFGRDWLHLDAPRHLQLYDPTTLRAVVERAGLAVKRVTTPSATAYFVFLASTLLQRRGRLPGVDVSAASMATRAAALVFWATSHRRVARGDPCGEEVLLVAERPAEATS